MESVKVNTEFLFEDENVNRKKLFELALSHVKHGKVLYIMQNELNELPELSQDLSSIDRHYIKMISFLYASDILSLIESLASLPEWRNVPSTIILDSLNNFVTQNDTQNACGIVALLLDSAQSCSKVVNTSSNLYISISKHGTYNELFNLLKELYKG